MHRVEKERALSGRERFARLSRTYSLPLAIGLGTVIFYIFHYTPGLNPVKPTVHYLVDTLTPFLIFTMLFTSFCKVELRQMKPHLWQFYLIAFQLSVSLGLVLIVVCNPGTPYKTEIESAVACIICPTAAAAAAIGGKLGGNESAMTTYTLMSNLAAAVGIPLIFSLLGSSVADSFLDSFFIIMRRVFPIIVLPLILAFLVRYGFKKLHHFIITDLKDAAFYLWVITLVSVTGTAWSNIVNAREDALTMCALVGIGFITCAVQFGLGKFMGHREGQRISAGQGLGQKNMVFGIWVVYSFLSPAAAIAPGCYMLWQNLVNGVQLAYKERFDRKRAARSLPPYRE